MSTIFFLNEEGTLLTNDMEKKTLLDMTFNLPLGKDVSLLPGKRQGILKRDASDHHKLLSFYKPTNETELIYAFKLLVNIAHCRNVRALGRVSYTD